MIATRDDATRNATRRDDRRKSKDQIYRLHVDDVCAAARDRARRRVHLVADEIFSGTRRRCLSGLQNLSLPARSKNSTTPSTPHVVRSVSEATAPRIDLAPPNLSMLRTDGAPDSDAVRASIGVQAAPSLVATTRTVRTSLFDCVPNSSRIVLFLTRDNSTVAYPRVYSSKKAAASFNPAATAAFFRRATASSPLPPPAGRKRRL